MNNIMQYFLYHSGLQRTFTFCHIINPSLNVFHFVLDQNKVAHNWDVEGE